MINFTETVLDWTEKGLSRRGFMATCGKVAIGLGAAMIGIASLPERARAACCPLQACSGCPSSATPGCPAACIQEPPIGRCCESGFEHYCYLCTCGGQACNCEYTQPAPC